MVWITDHGDEDMEEERIIVLAEEFIEYYEGSKRAARAGSKSGPNSSLKFIKTKYKGSF